MFSFYDKRISIGCSKFTVVWSEYIASANNGLTYGPDTKNITKWHAFQLCLCHNIEKVQQKFHFSYMCSDCASSARWLRKDFQK